MPKMNLNVVSFNIAGAGDMENILSANPEVIQDNPQIKKIAQKIIDRERPNPDEKKIFKNYAYTCYQQRAQRFLSKLIRDFHPDLICLQELQSKKWEYECIIEKLKDAGYTVVYHQDTSIAYKQSEFTQLPSDNKLQSSLNEKGAFHIDLKHQPSGKVIRTVSDHVPGFSSTNVKQLSSQVSDLKRAGTDNREIERLKALKREYTRTGDQSLQSNIAAVDFNPAHAISPDVIIFGLDANTTTKGLKRQSLHPKRVRLFENNGFKTDTEDNNPTIISTDLDLRKYDHVFAKTLKGDLTIKHRVIKGINDRQMLLYPLTAMSDHVPLLYKITVKT